MASVLSKSHRWRCCGSHRRTCCPSNRLHGLEENVEVCIFYVESWLRGNGCIPVNFKMEDAATAEISRAQVNISAPPHGLNSRLRQHLN